MQPALPGFDAASGDQPQAFYAYEKQGVNGGPNSSILTLRYPAGERALRSLTVFVKCSTDPGSREAQKYRYLASQGVPVPRLLAEIHKGAAEVILLEFLPVIGIDFHSPSEVDELLHLAAQVNAVQNPPDCFARPPGLPQAEFDEIVRCALIELAHERSSPFQVDAPAWFRAYQAAQAACRELPLALNHNEFFFQQAGWAPRGDGRQLVIFDLETMALAPRFSDIATFLSPLAAYTGRDPLDLFKVYFDRLRQLNRVEDSFEQALHELRLVETLETFSSLHWFLSTRQPGSSAGDAALLGNQAEIALAGLYRNLVALELI